MSLCKFVKEIESLEFQIQFSVVGGIEILQLAMERHPTLIALRSEISKRSELADNIIQRIVLLLGKVETETQLSYDESIAAYLYCLFKESPISAYTVSFPVLDYGGLCWSVQLAHKVHEYVRDLIDSVDSSSGIRKGTEYHAMNPTETAAHDVHVVFREFDNILIRTTGTVRQLAFPLAVGSDYFDSVDKMPAKSNENLRYRLSHLSAVELVAAG